MELELISAKEAQDLFPLIDPQYFVGALYDPVEGHVDPTGVTRAYVKCAQLAGAEVHQHTPVVGLDAATGRHVGRPARERRRDPRRARRQRRRAVGARGRPDGRASSCRSSRWSTSTSSPRTCPRSPPTSRRPATRCRWRSTSAARSTSARRAAAMLLGHVRAGVRAVVAARDAVGLRVAAAQARPRPHHARAVGRVQALPADGHDRHPPGGQRAVHVLA